MGRFSFIGSTILLLKSRILRLTLGFCGPARNVCALAAYSILEETVCA